MRDAYEDWYVDRYIKRLTLDEFEVRRELECDFHAPIENSIYGHLLDKLNFTDEEPEGPSFIGMDLGFKRDATSWWVFSPSKGGVVFKDFGIRLKGQLDEILDDIVEEHPDAFFFLPHDADRGGGCAVIDRFRERGIRAVVLPKTMSVEDDIKSMVKPSLKSLNFSFYDCASIKRGIEFLKMYRRNPNSGAIHHGTDGASDAADAFRYAIGGIYYKL